jgi:sterol desaturase/sphingolipid hydroxylase (fatty acid hydroxylase superfamily)
LLLCLIETRAMTVSLSHSRANASPVAIKKQNTMSAAVSSSPPPLPIVSATTPKPWWAVALTYLTIILFHWQPGVDRAALMVWLSQLPVFQQSPRVMVIAMNLALNHLQMFLPQIVFYVLYRGKFRVVEQYRIQKTWMWEKNNTASKTSDWAMIWRCVRKYIFDSFVFTYLAGGLYFWWLLRPYTDSQLEVMVLKSTPTWLPSTIKLMCGYVMYDTIFYWEHRACHQIPFLYRGHKIHHQFTQPVSTAGLWGGAIDSFIALSCLFIPCLVLQFSVYEYWMYSVVNNFAHIHEHCGYDFPYSPLQLIPFSGCVRQHNFHHSHSIDTYGLYFEAWDWICSTDLHYRKWVAKNAKLEQSRAAAAE